MKAMSAFPTNSKLYSTINETNSCPGTYCLFKFFPADVVLYNANYYMSCTPLYVKVDMEPRQLILWNHHVSSGTTQCQPPRGGYWHIFWIVVYCEGSLNLTLRMKNMKNDTLLKVIDSLLKEN